MSFRWMPLSRRAGLSRRTASNSAAQARRKTVLEYLEDRTLLSSTIPLNSTTWTSIGPNGVTGVTGAGGPESGRVTAIAADPTNASIIYLASAGGGVWKTTNAGQNWTPLTDNQPTLFIGSIAVSKSNPLVIYAGTGEANNSADSFSGQGILKSTDGGATWTLQNVVPFTGKTIGQIVIDPNNPLSAYAAVSANGVNATPGITGIYRTVDGGATWFNTTASISTTDTWSDLVLNPSNSQVLYAAVGTAAGSASNGVYKTVNGGGSWAPAGNFPGGATDGRIALAISASNPAEVIASVSNTSIAGPTLKALEITANGGTTWAPLASTPNYLDTNGNYANVVAINPSNPNNLFVAGTSTNNANAVLESTNLGGTWTDLTVDGVGTQPHDASHALAFDASGLLLDGNDGGIWRLQVAAPASFRWSDINGDLAITPFNSVALDPTTPNVAYGGAQGVGVVKFNDNPAWTQVLAGDGGHVAVDPTNSQTVYYESTGLSLMRSVNGGTTGTPITTGIGAADPIARVAPFVIDPSNHNHLLFGTNRLYTSANQGTTWTALTTAGAAGFNDSTPIVSIAIAKTNPSTIYVVTQDAKVFVSLDAGATWNEHDIPTATDTINQIVVDPSNANTAYAVRNAFNTAGVSTGHVFQTLNGGATWTDISGNLPDLPTWSIAIDTVAKQLYVGTDAGVYVDPIGATTWSVFKTGLPNAQVDSLEFNATLNLLIAGTHGRGAFEIIGTQTLTVTPDLSTAVEGAPINASRPVAEFSDPTLPLPPPSAYTATITWGDGTSSTASSISLLSDGNYGVFAPHTYGDEGSYPLFVSVTSTGGGSGSSLSSVAVTDARLLATTSPSSITAFEGTPFTGIVGSFLDLNPLATAADFTIAIRWGDGVTSAGTAVAEAGAPAGTFDVIGTHTYGAAVVQTTPTIRINVTDIGGSKSPTIFNFNTNVQDAALTALAPVTLSEVAGVPFTTVLGSFTDADTTANANYYAVAINWGDNTSSFFAPGSGVVVADGTQFDVTAGHTYAALGPYTINITVTDEGPNSFFVGSQVPLTATVNVSAAPIASASANPITSTEGVAFSGRVATFASTNRSATIADYAAPMIDWGDNSAPTAGTIVALGTNGKFAITGTHAYAEEGSYTVTTSVMPLGSVTTTTVSGTATVGDAPITVTALPQTATAGSAIVGTDANPIATFLDGNPTAPLSDFTATIDWGDGTTSQGVVTQPGGPGTQFNVITDPVGHTYPNAQSFPITVTVTDVGGSTDTSSSTAFVIEGEFQVFGVTPPPLTEGGSFTGPIATLVTANKMALPDEFIARIDWGDGTVEEGTITASPAGSGLFTISNPNGHVYAEEGAYTATVTVTNLTADVPQQTATSPVTVNDAPIVQAPPVVPLTGQAGTQVSGVVASFTEYANAPLTDFTATIVWGDGTSSPGTVAVAVGTAPGTFDVSGSHVYQSSALSFTPVVHVSDVGGSMGVLTGSVVLTDPTLSAMSSPITALKGQTFSGPVATFTDANPYVTAGEFIAGINWGDGTASLGTVVGSNGSFTVYGTHMFNVVAAAEPVTVSILHNIPGGASTTTGGFAHVLALLSGALSPASDSGPSNHDGITRVTTPVFSGVADAGATVQLFAAPAGNPAATAQIGTVVASATGHWSITSSALANGVYVISASQLDSQTGQVAQTVPISTGARFGTLVIATTGPTVSSVALDPSTATLHVIFQTGPAGIYLGGLLNKNNYVFEAIASSGALTPLTASSLTPVSLGSGRVEVNLRYNGGKALANGGYVVILHAAGLIDLAGNMLVEKNFVTFPQTTNSPNPDYVAEFVVSNGKATGPSQYISAAEQAAALAYLRSLRGRIVVRVPHPAPKPVTVKVR